MLNSAGGHSNARYVQLRLDVLYLSLCDPQHDADLVCRGLGYDMMRGPKWRNSRFQVGAFRRTQNSIYTLFRQGWTHCTQWR